MRLYLVRHGQSYVNLGGWDKLDNLDASLTDKGNQQAAALRDWLRQTGAKADALYTSTLRRARETSAYVSDALGLQPVLDDRLREIGGSYANGLPIEEMNLPRSFVEHRANVAPFMARSSDIEGIESWMHFRIRLAQFVDDLAYRHLEQTVYVVAHGGVVAAMFDNIFNVGPYRRCDVHNHNTSWTLFSYRPNHQHEPWSLWAHNRVDHLDARLIT